MKLAELIIEMTANTASLKRDFEQAGSLAKGFAASMKTALGGIGIGIGIGAIAEQIDEIGKYEEEIRLAGKSTGITTEQMSGLAYAAKQFEIPLHDVTMGLAYFDRVSGGLMRSKQGRVAVQLLGLDIRDLNGHMKMSVPVLEEIADKFSKLHDTSAKTAAATALFGQTYGLELIPFFDQGSKGIAALVERAKELGVVFGDKDAIAGQEARQSIINVTQAFRGLEIELTAKVFPAITRFGAFLAGDSSEMRAAKDHVEALGVAIERALLQSTPAGWFGPGKKAVESMKKEIDSLETDSLVAGQDLKKELLGFAGASGVGNTNLNIPANILQSGKVKSHVDEVAKSIRSLKEELIGLSEGPVAKGLDRLRDLGASPAQLAQGNALLTQIQNVKDAQKSQGEYNSALSSYRQLVSELSYSVSGLNSAQLEYAKTFNQLINLEAKGVDITDALALSRERYTRELIDSFNASQLGSGVPAGSGGDEFSGIAGLPGWTGSKFDKLQNQAKQLGHAMQDSFTGMIVQGQGFGNVMKNLTTLFAEFILKAVVFKELSSAFGTTGVGGLIGSFFGGLAGAKASGGPVTAGSLYMVGEQGPELFAPGMSGSIIPNGGMSAHGGATVNIDARGADAGVEHRVMRAMDSMRKQMAGQSLVMNYEYQARGGQL